MQTVLDPSIALCINNSPIELVSLCNAFQFPECFYLHYLIWFAPQCSVFQGITGIEEAIGLAQGHPVSNGAGRAASFPCLVSRLHLPESIASASLSKPSSLPWQSISGLNAAGGFRVDKVFATFLWECEHRATESNSKSSP